MSIVIMYVIFNLHVLVSTCWTKFTFIRRTEQVLIELDISAIEEYVIIIITQQDRIIIPQTRKYHLCEIIPSAEHIILILLISIIVVTGWWLWRT